MRDHVVRQLIVPCLMAVSFVPATAQSPQPWRQYASAADAGFSAERLEAARVMADSLRSGAVMIVYRGHVLAAWGDVERELELHSVRKSLVSALYGMAVAEGTIRLDATLGDLGIDDTVRLTDGEKRARVRDLISARSGVYLPAAYAGVEQDRERPARGSSAPGTSHFYNNWDFNVAGVIYEQRTGRPLYGDFLRRVAQPLGMEDWSEADGFLVYEPSRSRHPAHTFRMSSRDLARVGQLYLQQGRWNGRALLSPEWVRESTSPVSDFGSGQGYGYMWWTWAASSLGERYAALAPLAMFSASGTGGQAVIVIPAAELVIVHRGDTDHGRGVSGRNIWLLVDQVVAARQGAPVASPRLVPLAATPLASQLPPRPRLNAFVLPDEVLDRYAGNYELAPGVMIRVTRFGSGLFGDMPGRGEAQLIPLSANEFTIAVIPDVLMRFETNAAGEVTQVVGNVGRQPVRATRVSGGAPPRD